MAEPCQGQRCNCGCKGGAQEPAVTEGGVLKGQTGKKGGALYEAASSLATTVY